ncbi:MAG: EAL domain-containing protein [Leptospiraceae bacterium]|nr:EAL domain-containing protein [Leptospiraceae bacterium]MCP5495058.1 EAL domain-containing protein [Leptospiraceae bacterium]
MNLSKQLYNLILIMAVIVVGVLAITNYMLYTTTLNIQRERLIEIVKNKKANISTIAHYVKKKNPKKPYQETLRLIKKIHKKYNKFGETGEFLIGGLKDRKIFFYLYSDMNIRKIPPIPFYDNNKVAIPMKNALKGTQGIIIDLDYKGREVLAAYDFVEFFGSEFGLVAKMEVWEIRRPFVQTFIYTSIFSLLFISVGAFLFIEITKPIFQKLKEKETQIRSIIHTAYDGIVSIDEKGDIQLFSRSAENMFGYTAKEIIGDSFFSLLEENHFSGKSKTFSKKRSLFLKKISGKRLELVGIKKDLTRFPIIISINDNTIFNIQSYTVIIQDWTKEKEKIQKLNLASKVFESSNEAIIVTDTSGNIIDVNSTFEFITGYSKAEVIGKNPSVMKSGIHEPEFYKNMWDELIQKGRWQGEVWDKRKNGFLYPKLLSLSSIVDDKGVITHFVGIFSDISNIKQNEKRLEKLALYDNLTQLPNRTLFTERLRQAVIQSKRESSYFALFFLDLDRFKYVNDTFGHKAGDILLQEFAGRLKQCLRESDTISRLGGDEFTVIIRNIKTTKVLPKIAEKIINSFKTPFMIENREIYLSTSIGITVFPLDSEDMEELLKNADTAMYHAKENGKNRFEFFSQTILQKSQDRLFLENKLHQAIKKGEFFLAYQPRIQTETGKMVCVEVLIRWKSENTTIFPNKFLPIAEDIGLIQKIGEWVFQTACEQLQSWRKQGLGSFRIAINCSGNQLKQTNFKEMILIDLANYNLEPNDIELELTETAIIEQADELLEILYNLQQIGVHISLDDFGIGYTSLGFLKKFPINSVKIDKSFIAEVTTNKDSQAIVNAIVAMATSLGIEVVAEGVETIEQRDYLQSIQCNLMQGYYYSKPLDSKEFIKYLQNSFL